MGAMVNAARKVYRIAKKAAGVTGPADSNPFPVGAWTDAAYAAWFEKHKAPSEELDRQRRVAADFKIQPTFSLIVPLYKTPLDYLKAMADSVLDQTYSNLQLVLVNASPELPALAFGVHAL